MHLNIFEELYIIVQNIKDIPYIFLITWIFFYIQYL